MDGGLANANVGGLKLTSIDDVKTDYIIDLSKRAAEKTWDSWFKDGEVRELIQDALAKSGGNFKAVPKILLGEFVAQTIKNAAQIAAGDGLKGFGIPDDAANAIGGMIGNVPLDPTDIANLMRELGWEIAKDAWTQTGWLNTPGNLEAALDMGQTRQGGLSDSEADVLRNGQLSGFDDPSKQSDLADVIGIEGLTDAIPDDFPKLDQSTQGLPPNLTGKSGGDDGDLSGQGGDGSAGSGAGGSGAGSGSGSGGTTSGGATQAGVGGQTGAPTVGGGSNGGSSGSTGSSGSSGGATTGTGGSSGTSGGSGGSGGGSGGSSGSGSTGGSGSIGSGSTGTTGGSGWSRSSQWAGRNENGESIIVTYYTRTDANGNTVTTSVTQTFDDHRENGPKPPPPPPPPPPAEEPGEDPEPGGDEPGQSPAPAPTPSGGGNDDPDPPSTPGDDEEEEDEESDDNEEDDSNESDDGSEDNDDGEDDDGGSDSDDEEADDDSNEEQEEGSTDDGDDGEAEDGGDAEEEDTEGYTPLYGDDAPPVDFTIADAFEIGDQVADGLTNPEGPGGSRDAVLSGAAQAFGDAAAKTKLDIVSYPAGEGGGEEEDEPTLEEFIAFGEEKAEDLWNGPRTAGAEDDGGLGLVGVSESDVGF